MNYDVSERELLTFTAQFADGECLCAEIDPSDRPCLTCEGLLALCKLRGERVPNLSPKRTSAPERNGDE